MQPCKLHPLPNTSSLIKGGSTIIICTHVSVQAVVSAPLTSSTSVPPASSGPDEFGDFQQGHASTLSKPHLTGPPLEHAILMPATSSSQPKTEANLASAFPVPEYNPPPGDKYSVFSDLSHTSPAGGSQGGDVLTTQHSLGTAFAGGGTTISGSSLASSSSLVESASGDKYGALAEPTVLTSASFSNGGKSSSRSGGGGGSVLQGEGKELEDDFGLFSSGPPPLSTSALTSSMDEKKEQGWADFVQFPSQPATLPQQSASSSSLGALSLGPTRTPVATSFGTSFAPAIPTFGTGLTLGTSFTPTTMSTLGIGLSTATATSTSTTSSVSTLDNLPVLGLGAKPEETSDLASLLGDLNFNPPSSVPETKRKGGKALTGLQILEEEFSNRLLSSSQQQDLAPSLSMSPSLIPTAAGPGSTSSLDKFGEFESFSVGKGDGLESASGSMTNFGKVCCFAKSVRICKWGSC